MHSFIFNGTVIEYQVKKTKRKTIAIKISPEEGVTLSVPMRCNEDTIRRVINERAQWIYTKVTLMNTRTKALEERKYISGEKLLLLGDTHNFKIEVGDYKQCSAVFDKEGFKVQISENILEEFRKNVAKEALVKLYRQLANRFLNERTQYFANILKVKPNRITIKEQKSVWGSCSSKKNINYNWKIIMAPIKIVDYLVVHELCHILQPNHSEAYWSLVEGIIPDYKERKRWLVENGVRLNIDKVS